jgi:predicted lactoylglutathione lyase
MRKSIIIIAIAAISTLTTMLVVERQYSNMAEQQLRLTAPDSAALTALNADTSETPVTTKAE